MTKKTEGNELMVQENNEKEIQIITLISQAIEKGMPVDVMERLLNLQREIKADVAREAFIVALGNFQKDIPVINKTKQVLNKDGTLRYQFAPLDVIVQQIKKPLADYGLSFSWTSKNSSTGIDVTVTITHKLGYSTSSSFEVNIDTEGYMTGPQKFASALTFAKRYSLINALGISTADEDTDASDVEKEKEAKSNKAKIVFLLKGLGENIDDKTKIPETIKRLTKLEAIEENFKEIVEILEYITTEKNLDHENTKI